MYRETIALLLSLRRPSVPNRDEGAYAASTVGLKPDPQN